MISRSRKPMSPVRTSRGPARDWTKMLLGNWRRSRARVSSPADLRLQFGVKGADLAGQQYEMQQHIGVHDQKDQRPQDEESLERQFDIEERQFDRVFEQQVAVRDRAGGNGEIKQHKQIAEPQAGADARRIDDGVAQCPQILRPGGERCRLRLLRRRSRFRLDNMLHFPRRTRFKLPYLLTVTRLPSRGDAEKLADALGGFEAVAGQHHDRRLDPGRSYRRATAGSARRRRSRRWVRRIGRAGPERPAPARSRLRRRRRRRPLSGATPATPRRCAPAGSWRSRRRSSAAPETARTRRHRRPRRLPMPRNSPPAPRTAAAGFPISPRLFELVEAAVEAEDVAAVAGRHQDVVGHAKAELLPQLEGQGLGALDKIGVPVVARVKAFAGRGERGLGHRLGACPGLREPRRRMRRSAPAWRAAPRPGHRCGRGCRPPRRRSRSTSRHSLRNPRGSARPRPRSDG